MANTPDTPRAALVERLATLLSRHCWTYFRVEDPERPIGSQRPGKRPPPGKYVRICPVCGEEEKHDPNCDIFQAIRDARAALVEAFDPHAHLPGEYDVGRLIREAAEYDTERGRFYLTCSSGELAQRICSQAARALALPPTQEEERVRIVDAVRDAITNYCREWGKATYAGAAAEAERAADRILALSLPPTQEGERGRLDAIRAVVAIPNPDQPPPIVRGFGNGVPTDHDRVREIRHILALPSPQREP